MKDPGLLNNFQLYEMIRNHKLDEQIQAIARLEFNSRNLSKEQIQEIVNGHNYISPPRKNEPLPIGYKILALVIPFV